MDERTENILKILYKYDDGLGFREIMKELGMNQVPLQRRLKDLLTMKYITILNSKEWRLGKKRIYVLTKGGNKEVRNILDIRSIIMDVHNRISQIPERLGNIKTWSRNSKLRDKSVIIEISIKIEKK